MPQQPTQPCTRCLKVRFGQHESKQEGSEPGSPAAAPSLRTQRAAMETAFKKASVALEASFRIAAWRVRTAAKKHAAELLRDELKEARANNPNNIGPDLDVEEDEDVLEVTKSDDLNFDDI